MIVYTENRTSKENITIISEKKPKVGADIEIILLIGRGTASAAEVFVSALQEYDRATVLGESSFGKGSVQRVIPLKQGGAIRLTTDRYFTPKGKSIDGNGVQPDVYFESTVLEQKILAEVTDPKERLLKDKLVLKAIEILG